MITPIRLGVCWTLIVVSSGLFADERPNIIVFYTDDHGHADLSCQGVVDDIKTPHVDALAASGARMVHGYSTAPQCVPSRGGLLVGKFQSRFGLESNGASLAGFDREQTIAERLQDVGYVTAQFGKWHLGPTPKIPDHGFRHVFSQNAARPFSANISLDGQDTPMSAQRPELYHIDGCSRAAASIIRRYRDQPFFLYIAYRAPHVPLDAPPKYLNRFPGEMPERRRQALAMLSAVDDGVGLITQTLAEQGLTDETLIFYIGDNGAPLKIHKADIPGGGPGWDGSLNDPLNGEKGMLAEGGMHVPFVVAWPGTIPGGQQYAHPVSALDVAATAAALAGVEQKRGDFDGVNLIPFVSGQDESPPHESLMWRWVAQSAIRQGKWKLLRGGKREYLYDLEADLEERHNLIDQHPKVAERLRGELTQWAKELDPPGLAQKPMSEVWEQYFDVYLDGKPAPPLRSKFTGTGGDADMIQGWIARGGKLAVADGSLEFVPSDNRKGRRAFLARTGFRLSGPVKVVMTFQAAESRGKRNGVVAWRTKDQNEFQPECSLPFQISKKGEWESTSFRLPVEGEMIHLRLQFPDGKSAIRDLELQSAEGETVSLWNGS